MLKYLILLVCMFNFAQATEVSLFALGQPLSGSFYLPDSRNLLRNPALITDAEYVSYDVDAKDLFLVDDHIAVVGGKTKAKSSSVLGAYKFSEMGAISAYGTVEDGKFFDDKGFTLGGAYDGVEGYISWDKSKASNTESMLGGIVLPYDKYTMFVQYTDIFDSSEYNLLVGLAKKFEYGLFADLTYVRGKSAQDLALTAGIETAPSTDLTLMASVEHQFVFGTKSKMAAGAEYQVVKDFWVGGALAVSPFTKDEVKYKNLDTKLSFTYML